MGRHSASRSPARNDHSILAATASSFRSGSPLAEQVLAEDLEACSTDSDHDGADSGDELLAQQQRAGDEHPEHVMFRRPSAVAFGAARPVFNPASSVPVDEVLTPLERKQSRNAERSLLRDNHVLPPKHPQRQRTGGPLGGLYRRLFSTKLPPRDEEQHEPANPRIVVRRPTETSPLLAAPPPPQPGSATDEDDLDEQWEQAVAEGRLRTTWQRESKTILAYSGPLIVTFMLQYSINVMSIFAVGHIGMIELGAVSLANMTAAITCFAPFQGLATSLDTLCAQAYGSGHKHLVGLQFQRMSCFLFCLTLPVVAVWWFAEDILRQIVPEPESARLAGVYLRVMIFSIPGFILFEGGKRFTQAQGLFQATTYVLVIVAPINVFLMWLLVWRLEYGFVGAPIAVAITENLLPIFLFLYVRFVDGHQCWGGFSRRAFSNWWTMIRLALPGMVMVEAEWLAFEIMTLLSSRWGAEYLAAQSVIATLATITYQIPFPMSIAASTRVANLIGAGLVDAAKTTAKVTFVAASLIGVFNLIFFSTLRYHLPLLFTSDAEVIAIVANVLPVCAAMQVFDCLSAGAHGLLRGIGKQSIGGPANLFAYYVISLPISLGLGFGLDWRLQGMWFGATMGLLCVSLIEYSYLLITDWEVAAMEAEARNVAG
ncbi:hypothetical protein S7711_08251 [Stachybotrys chartarum IBT 7711]|uniref:MATE efflux family protein n=1 Tax=Stachybotrys chartarum (strain CBS 109288 / IBT 7711) TaxID=1280523 RepID=A0A084AJU3_STACB|nr:hypothetical protein S7711_08251 [Stachybotrys chartarum IBT 7711]